MVLRTQVDNVMILLSVDDKADRTSSVRNTDAFCTFKKSTEHYISIIVKDFIYVKKGMKYFGRKTISHLTDSHAIFVLNSHLQFLND